MKTSRLNALRTIYATLYIAGHTIRDLFRILQNAGFTAAEVLSVSAEFEDSGI